MQPALHLRASDRIATWRHPLSGLARIGSALREQMEMLQFGGATAIFRRWGATPRPSPRRSRIT
jgi:NADH:ubiquinone oxidoreductase subunit B-like Fe-S oxidoreductase